MDALRLNSDIFMDHFNAIESWLRRLTKSGRNSPLSQVVRIASAENSVVKRYNDEIKRFSDLRNVIVHEERDRTLRAVAEPNDRTVKEIKQLREALTSPPSVLPKFQVRVRTRSIDDPIGMAANDMKENDFSQIPIIQGGSVTALLTSGTIARWLSHEFRNEIISLLETTISDVLSHTEDPEHYCILPRTSSLLEVLDKFEDFSSRGKILDAVIITQSGSPKQQPLGIITLADIPTILIALGFNRATSNNGTRLF
jgi:predicted transcriptional regulator